MGQCTGNRSKPPLNGVEAYWKEPHDTQKYANCNLPKLQFQELCVCRVVFTQQYLSIRVQINDFETFLLKEKKIKSDDTAKWSFDQKFGFSMTEYQLRKSFVKITFIEQDNKEVGSISINLYRICDGPYHQDYGLKLKKGENFRVSFDMKISQVIEIRLESIEAEVKLATKHPGEKFNYSIKTIVGYNTPLNISSNSYNVQVMIDDKEEKQLSQEMQCCSPQLQRRNSIKIKNPVKYIKANHNLVWKKEDMLQMPSVYMKILVSQLHHSYFQILIWKINDNSITADGVEIPQLYGECYIALHKLFDKDPVQAKLEGLPAEQRIIQGNEKIWHHGRSLGTGSFKFNVVNQKYIKQMHIMVRSEQGIVKHSPVFSRNKNKKSGCKEIQQIIKISEEIQLNVQALDKLQKNQSFPSIQSRRLKISIEKHLEDLVVLLQKSDKESLIFFYYSSELELYRAQEIFIALGFKILSYLEEEDVLINQLCWQILVGLIRRGQFLLAHIGFDTQQRENIKKNNIGTVLEQRIEIAVTYFQLLRKLLELGLNSLNIKGVDYERCFAEMFCAYSYFRIPNFRTKFLEIISHEGNPDVPEWRGIEFNLQDDINYGELQQQVDAFSILCDWDRHFHKCLQNQQRYQSALNEIQQLLDQEDWKVRMTKRGIAFFHFVKYWIQYIESLVVKTRDVQWKYFPGYNKLVKCYLLEMKKRPIMEYPDALKIACFKLLSNEKLINPICLIIFNKANIYEPLTVVKAIEFLNEIFTVICRTGRKIPPTFNYHTLYRAIKIILDGDFQFAISKTMIMLYANFKMFSLQFRRHLSMLLLGKVFFPLFLHWSSNIRDIFHHLVVMRIYRESLEIESESLGPRSYQQEVNDQIRTRYKTLLNIIRNASKMKKQDKQSSFAQLYQKEIHKKLKKKIQDRKRAQRKLTSSDFMDKDDCERSGVLEPCSPNSEKIDKSSLFGDKYSTTYLTKKKEAERSQSELIKPSFKMTYTIARKDPEVQRLNRQQNRHQTFNYQIYDLTAGKKEMRTFDLSGSLSQYDYEDFKIVQHIEPQMLEYLDRAMKEFDVIRENLQKNLNNKSWEIPAIRMEVPLDTREILPEKIDDL